MSESLWFVSLLVLAGIVCWAVDRDRMRWKRTAKNALQEAQRWEGIAANRTQQLGVWINRAFALGYTPTMSEVQATNVLRDLFSTERDVERLQEWRERRAVTSRDHLTRHTVEASCDSEAAREILVFTVGGNEVQE